jgi:hypothetical protein
MYITPMFIIMYKEIHSNITTVPFSHNNTEFSAFKIICTSYIKILYFHISALNRNASILNKDEPFKAY